ncbi:hypothetical protein SteCoe_33552 [Stentor coeruleus]|uniref:Peptidase S1 domain-containing protein n=1 Tax=Stentor coeruleus TaxID=5963 RepID=A0A1R2AWT8_9CILI|nr:hypothetical protein SteCoe_33552 [Stentor coeruleus]
MGDILYFPWGSNPYKLIENSIGCVIIRKRDESGILFEEPTTIIQEEKKFMIFSKRGTAFIIEKFSKPFQIKNKNWYALGFAVTAAHTIYNSSSYTIKISTSIKCGFNKRDLDTMRLCPLKSWCNESSRELRASNGNLYYLPGDVALCLVVSKNVVVEISEIPLGKCNRDIECSILGFPSTKVPNPVAICPYLRNEKDAKEKIKSIFHKNRDLVESKGYVLYNEDLLEISCSGTLGLSGSPVIANGYAIGVFVGGPPLPGQREIFKISEIIESKKNIEEAWNLLLSLQTFNSYYINSLFQDLIENDDVRTYFASWFLLYNYKVPNILNEEELFLITNCLDLSKELLNSEQVVLNLLDFCVHECLGEYKNVNELNFNVAISTNNIAFENITALLNEFKLVSKEFITYNDIKLFFSH